MFVLTDQELSDACYDLFFYMHAYIEEYTVKLCFLKHLHLKYPEMLNWPRGPGKSTSTSGDTFVVAALKAQVKEILPPKTNLKQVYIWN